jgi:hypothetical protein
VLVVLMRTLLLMLPPLKFVNYEFPWGAHIIDFFIDE